MGLPYINLDLERLKDHQVPALGVYGGRAIFSDKESYTAAISVGIKPTFGIKQLCIEAHLLDCNKDLYGKSVSLEFHTWVRDQYPFPNIMELKHQLQKDVALIRKNDELVTQRPLVASRLQGRDI
ncbi:riboflavin kinase [Planctomycetota bacterium]|nr:riboflavin kinase [Planctomycetota bacterium]